MDTIKALERIPDTKRDDPIAKHPGSPRWIFFDDKPPSPEERKARAELITALEKECAKRHPDWVDPEIDRYHARMSDVRKAIWDFQWERRIAPDTRNRLLAKLAGLDIANPNSYSNLIKEKLREFLPMSKVISIVAKLRLTPAIRDALDRPQIVKVPVTKRIARTRIEPKVTYTNTGPFCKTRKRKFWEVIHKFTSKQTDFVAPSDQTAQFTDWWQIHRQMGFPTIGLDLDFMPVTRTLFLNPDGSRWINVTDREKSPKAATAQFMKRHKLPKERVSYERVHYTDLPESFLRQHKLKPSPSGHHLWVVFQRKLTNEELTNYYDPNPLMKEVCSTTIENGIARREWSWEYQWTGGFLLCRDLAIDKDDPFAHNPNYVPKGTRRLTVRDHERATLAGAECDDGIIDIVTRTVTADEEIIDTRDTPFFETPMRAQEAMSDDEQLFFYWLKEMGLEDLADMLRIDYTDLPQGYDDDERSQAAITILKELGLREQELTDDKGNTFLAPSELNKELMEFISQNTSSDWEYDTTRMSLWDLLDSLESAMSLELRTSNHFTVYQTPNLPD